MWGQSPLCFLVFFYDPHEQAHERIFSISISMCSNVLKCAQMCSNVLKYDVIGLVVYKCRNNGSSKTA